MDSERLTLNQSTSNRAPDIVLIEDNEDGIMSTRLALNQAKLAINLCHEGWHGLLAQGEASTAMCRELTWRCWI